MSKHSLEKGRVAEEALKGAVLAYCREKFHYDPLSGNVHRKDTGAIVGYVGSGGYVCIAVLGRDYLAHRLVWLMSYGEWPSDTVDHINGVKSDNRLCNLRVVGLRENCNNPATSKNTSGYPGVHWHKQTQKWRAQIRIDGKRRYLGLFDDPAQAHSSYLLAAETLINNKE